MYPQHALVAEGVCRYQSSWLAVHQAVASFPERRELVLKLAKLDQALPLALAVLARQGEELPWAGLAGQDEGLPLADGSAVF